MTLVKIKLVDWGVANRFGDVIEIHKDLIKFPSLFSPILEHELSHTNEKGYKFDDFKADFFPQQNIKRRELWKFMLKRPKTWIQILPFYYQPSKGFVYDVSKIILWLILISALGIDFILFYLVVKGGS